MLRDWRERLLAPGGFVACVEVSGLLRHAPLAPAARRALAAAEADAAAAARYDWRPTCGRPDSSCRARPCFATLS
jgi:hypothetical protein